jgi:hypothetical protein
LSATFLAATHGKCASLVKRPPPWLTGKSLRSLQKYFEHTL